MHRGASKPISARRSLLLSCDVHFAREQPEYDGLSRGRHTDIIQTGGYTYARVLRMYARQVDEMSTRTPRDKGDVLCIKSRWRVKGDVGAERKEGRKRNRSRSETANQRRVQGKRIRRSAKPRKVRRDCRTQTSCKEQLQLLFFFFLLRIAMQSQV